MVKIGEIVFGTQLVVGVTQSGIPVQYVNLRNNRVFLTSYGYSWITFMRHKRKKTDKKEEISCLSLN